MELHGGSLIVSSDGEGQGCVFSVTLPLHAVAMGEGATSVAIDVSEDSDTDPCFVAGPPLIHSDSLTRSFNSRIVIDHYDKGKRKSSLTSTVQSLDSLGSSVLSKDWFFQPKRAPRSYSLDGDLSVSNSNKRKLSLSRRSESDMRLRSVEPYDEKIDEYRLTVTASSSRKFLCESRRENEDLQTAVEQPLRRSSRGLPSSNRTPSDSRLHFTRGQSAVSQDLEGK